MPSQARLGSVIRSAAAPGVVMARVVEQALVLIRAAEGSAVELSDGPTMTYVAALGSLAGMVGLRLAADGSLSGLAVRRGSALRCDDARMDPRVDREACERVGAVSMVCVPLGVADRPVGVLKVTSGSPNAFSGEDVALLTGLAGFVSAAITAAHQVSDAADQVLKRYRTMSAGVDSDAADETSRFVANVLDPGMLVEMDAVERIEALCSTGDFQVFLQPIVGLGDGNLIGAEALTRFRGATPDIVFAEAARVGRGVALEVAAAAKALACLPSVPEGCYLAVNFSPQTLMHDEAVRLLRTVEPSRIVVELTEHVAVADYPSLVDVLSPLRESGVRVAVDDTGAGFSSLTQIVKLAPDIVKLDFELVRGVDIDPVRRSLIAAVVAFTGETGSTLVAEGIETRAELGAIVDLGVPAGQGYLLGRPRAASELRGWETPSLCRA